MRFNGGGFGAFGLPDSLVKRDTVAQQSGGDPVEVTASMQNAREIQRLSDEITKLWNRLIPLEKNFGISSNQITGAFIEDRDRLSKLERGLNIDYAQVLSAHDRRLATVEKNGGAADTAGLTGQIATLAQKHNDLAQEVASDINAVMAFLQQLMTKVDSVQRAMVGGAPASSAVVDGRPPRDNSALQAFEAEDDAY